jgi:adenylyltransferase/sulfurtransferase
MQSQEALKIIHQMPIEPGNVIHFNGMVNEMHTTAYRPRQDCESHWVYGEVSELPLRAQSTTLEELLHIARTELGPEAVIELDQELILALECSSCQTNEKVLQPISEVSFEAAHCPNCGNLRETHLTHTITGGEDFLNRTLASVGVPPLHILRAYNAQEYRFYELTADLEEALHFSHFDESSTRPQAKIRERIRLGQKVKIEDLHSNPAHGRISLLD